MPLMETDSVSEPLGGGVEVNRDYLPELSNTVEAEKMCIRDSSSLAATSSE